MRNASAGSATPRLPGKRTFLQQAVCGLSSAVNDGPNPTNSTNSTHPPSARACHRCVCCVSRPIAAPTPRPSSPSSSTPRKGQPSSPAASGDPATEPSRLRQRRPATHTGQQRPSPRVERRWTLRPRRIEPRFRKDQILERSLRHPASVARIGVGAAELAREL